MKTVLSIDGGGIRGLIPALVLAEIERRAGQPISDLFDLVAGTSTGGILALGLARDDGRGRPAFAARRLAALYRDRGREIFSRSFWRGVASVGALLDEKYPAEGLERVLEEYFGDEPLGAARTDVLLTSYDIENRAPFFFKSWREEWAGVPMRLAARATSAAPTYFEPVQVPAAGGVHALIDGGVFINNPAMSAYAECVRRFPDEDVFLVSIGTGELTRPIPFEEARDWGRAEWLLPLLGCMFDGVADAVNYQLSHLLGDRFVRFQVSLVSASDDMDDASRGNLDNLAAEARRLIRAERERLSRVVEILTTRRLPPVR